MDHDVVIIEKDIHCNFITSVTKYRIPFFLVTMFRDSLLRGIEYFREKHGFKLAGYVVMPDHFQGLLLSHTGLRISDVVRDIKAYSGREISRILGDKGGVWESGFTNREISTEDEFESILTCMHENPVKRFMVQTPEDYPYSSCRYYLNGEEGPVRIDACTWHSEEQIRVPGS